MHLKLCVLATSPGTHTHTQRVHHSKRRGESQLPPFSTCHIPAGTCNPRDHVPEMPMERKSHTELDPQWVEPWGTENTGVIPIVPYAS